MKNHNKPSVIAPVASVFRACGVYVKRLYWPVLLIVSALDIAFIISLARMPNTEPDTITPNGCTCSDDAAELAAVQAEISQALKK
jgi:hypothetical protein